jgi:hypothetical protein
VIAKSVYARSNGEYIGSESASYGVGPEVDKKAKRGFCLELVGNVVGRRGPSKKESWSNRVGPKLESRRDLPPTYVSPSSAVRCLAPYILQFVARCKILDFFFFFWFFKQALEKKRGERVFFNE